MRAGRTLLTITSLLLLLTGCAELLGRHHAQPEREKRREGWGRLFSQPPATPDPALRPLNLLDDGLLAQLSEADRAWIPRTEPLPDGRVRYVYRRRPGDPELSVAQLQSLIAQPPSHSEEQRSIVDLLGRLQRIGVSVSVSEPIRPGAAAEWDPRERTLRIRPDVISQGSREFARVINHEAVHVAQSCFAGGVGASPRPLGLDTETQAIGQLADPVYAGLSTEERRMEAEAYTLQDRMGVGLDLIGIHCPDGGPT